MSRYMFIARYDSAGVKGVVSKGGTARASVIKKVAADLGGRMETFDFAFGEDDVYTLCELPDNNGRVPRHGCELHRASPCPHRGPDEPGRHRCCNQAGRRLHAARQLTLRQQAPRHTNHQELTFPRPCR